VQVMEWVKGLWRSLAWQPLAEETERRLAAYFWEGGTPLPHPVSEVNLHGAHIATGEEWYPGTIIQMTLQNTAQPFGDGNGTKAVAVSVKSKVAAQEPGKIKVEFLYLNDGELRALRRFLEEVRSRGER